MAQTRIDQALDRYYTAFNSLDPDAVAHNFTEDCVFEDKTLGRRMKGLDSLRDFVRLTAATSPGFQLVPHRIVSGVDQAAVTLTMSGTHAASGIAWSVPSTSFFRFKGEKIRHKEDLWNLASVMEQVGLLEVPELEDALAPSWPEGRNARARELARRLWGIKTIPDISDDGFQSPGLEHLFGEIWPRPGLALRDRSLITVAALTVLAREQELSFHMRGALGAGVKPQEIREAILHLAYYGGYPVAAIARRVAADVLPTEDAA